MRRRRWAVAAVVVATTGVAACGTDVDAPAADPTTTAPSGATPEGAPPVDEAEARAAVETFMQANNDANDDLDTEVLIGVETGSAAALDEAYYRGQRNLQGDDASGSTFTWDDVQVHLPRQRQYPRSFVATVDITEVGSGVGAIQVQVYEKAGESAGWKLSQYVNLEPGSELPDLAADADGYLPDGEPGALLVAPDDVPEAVADRLADPEGEGDVSSSGAIADARQAIVDRVAADARRTINHDVEYDVPTSPGYPTYSFALEGGGALVLGVTGVREQVEARQGTLDVPADLTGGLVPGGDAYTRIETRSLLAFMAAVPPDGAGDQAEVLAVYQGVIVARAE